MPNYIVRETVTLIHYIEAENEQSALDQFRTTSVRDFDHVDSSLPERITVELDKDAED